MDETNNASAEKSRTRFTILLRASDRSVVRSTHSIKRQRIVYLARNEEWATAYLKVRYGDGDLVNEGEYTTYDDLMAALNAFGDPELLRYVAEGIDL